MYKFFQLLNRTRESTEIFVLQIGDKRLIHEHKEHPTILINTNEFQNKFLIDIVRSKPMIERFYKFTVLILNQRISTLYFSPLYAF